MGTHGRNAITLSSGQHICHEQEMDGHSAATDILNEIITGPNLKSPTMVETTDECGQVGNFGHIDYKRKIIYSGVSDPRAYADDEREEYAQKVLEGVTRLEKDGWRFVWNCNKCPKEYNCANSIPIGIKEFIKNTPNYQWESFLNEYGRNMTPGLGARLLIPFGLPNANRNLQLKVRQSWASSQPNAIIKIATRRNEEHMRIEAYVQAMVGRKPLRGDSDLRALERQAKDDPRAQQHFDAIAPPIWRILSVTNYIANEVKEGRLTSNELYRIVITKDRPALIRIITEFLNHPIIKNKLASGEDLRRNPTYRCNPITPNRLFMVLYRAIWPTTDAGSAGEAEMARNLAIKYLQEVTPADLPQLQDVLFRVWEGPAKQRGSLEKFNDIYTTAAKTNKVLPATLAAFSNLKIPGSPGVKLQSTPPPKSSPPPKTGAPPKASQSVAPKQPESRATCKACDGKGYTTKIDKENVIKEGKRITCSRCGGTGFEPPPSTGKKGGFWRGSRQQQTEEEEDINRATDNFLKKHGFDKWGRP